MSPAFSLPPPAGGLSAILNFFNSVNFRQACATSGIGVLATYAYDNLGLRTSLTRGNGTSTSYSYDAASRLSPLGQDFAGTSSDLTLSFSHNPAAQIASVTRSNDAFAYGGHANANVTDTHNGLNQITANGGTSITHGDARGNITAIGSTGYAYTAENRMYASSSANLLYDPGGRLMLVSTSASHVRLDMLGDQQLITELDSSHNILRRYVHAPGVDQPIVWYEGSGTSDRRFLHADERGSIVAVSNSSGAVTNVNSYDDYGRPASANVGRFQYTGQPWLPELGMYYYRARAYNPILGRFMQTDPIGYEAGMNLYGYVGGDPVNRTDPLGLQDQEVVVTGPSRRRGPSADLVRFSNTPPDWDWTDNRDHDMERAQQSGQVHLAQLAVPGGPITEEQIRCRSCHGVDTLDSDRYTTEEENERLETLAAALFPWARVSRAVSAARGVAAWLRPGYRVIHTRSGNRVYESADGMRRFRIDTRPPQQGRWGGAHVQFEVRNARGRFVPAPGVPQHIYFRSPR